MNEKRVDNDEVQSKNRPIVIDNLGIIYKELLVVLANAHPQMVNVTREVEG